jgi:hypothetical protein
MDPAEPGHERPRHHDDLLSGFDEPDRRSTELRGFFASAIGASLVAWELAFDYGAYHTVFYSRLFQIFVVASVMLLGSLVLRREIKVRPWMFAVLSVPVAWLVFRAFAPSAGNERWFRILDAVLIGLTVLSLPLILWVLARILAPDYFALSSRRLRVVAVGIVVVIAAVGFLVGRFNDRVVTCNDFVLAGDDTPANCAKAPPPVPLIDR